MNLKAHLDAVEQMLIEAAMVNCKGVVADAARLLGLNRTTLVAKLRKFRNKKTNRESDDGDQGMRQVRQRDHAADAG